MLNKRSKTNLKVIFMTCMTTVALAGVPVADISLLDVNFNDKVPGSFLGEGGAELGEPVDLSSLTGEVIEDTLGENFLMVENNSGNTSGHSLRWEFLNNQEITQGVVTFSFQFTPSALERYSIGVRESGGSAEEFLSLAYSTGGTFSGTDAAGVITMANNTFAADVTQNFEITFDMDAGTSELIINGNVVFTGREHGITNRGVGLLLTGYRSSNNSAPFTLDNISVVAQVELPLVLDANFEDKVLGQPIGTGGAFVGEPEFISNNLTTEIIEFGIDNQALLMDNTTGSALLVNWTLLNEREIISGHVVVEVDVEFDALDQYRISVGGINISPVSYVSLTFAQTGSIGAFDRNGFVGFIGNYNANQKYRLRLVFDLDADLYTVILDDDVLIEDLAYTAGGNGGIFQVQTGFQSTALINSTYVIDNLQVGANAMLNDDIFANGFESAQ